MNFSVRPNMDIRRFRSQMPNILMSGLTPKLTVFEKNIDIIFDLSDNRVMQINVGLWVSDGSIDPMV